MQTVALTPGYYRLDWVTGLVAPCTLTEWAAANLEPLLRKVGHTETSIGLLSTVFLGVDHGFRQDGPPILFETMFFPAFGDGGGQEMARTHSFARACAWHRRCLGSLARGLDMFGGDERAFESAVRLGDSRLPSWFWGGYD